MAVLLPSPSPLVSQDSPSPDPIPLLTEKETALDTLDDFFDDDAPIQDPHGYYT